MAKDEESIGKYCCNTTDPHKIHFLSHSKVHHFLCQVKANFAFLNQVTYLLSFYWMCALKPSSIATSQHITSHAWWWFALIWCFSQKLTLWLKTNAIIWFDIITNSGPSKGTMIEHEFVPVKFLQCHSSHRGMNSSCPSKRMTTRWLSYKYCYT